MSSASAVANTHELAAGQLLRGKYRVDGVLGEGGMGVVLDAFHVDLERRVAIKVLHSTLRDNAELVERFVREGRAASRIEGDHIARVFDVDRLQDGTPFLVMEYLDGHDLSFVRKQRVVLPIRDAIEYVLQACTAIAQAHACGVIHRDVKPANLFLTKLADGRARIKVLDFGISKVTGPLGRSEPSVTRTSLVMGSVEYMSPEQMLSTRDVDVRTDVWALGVVLFELLTAAPPFSGENTTQICAHVMSQLPVPPRSLRADLPEAIEHVILCCLEKDRTRRYPTVDALSQALRATLTSTHIGLGPATAGAPETRHAPTPRMPLAPVHPNPAPGSDPRLSLPTAVLPTDTSPPEAASPFGSPSGTRVSDTGPKRPSSQPSSTTVGVASEAIPRPPKTSSNAGLLVLLLAGVVGASATAWFVMRTGEPRAALTEQPPAAASPSPPAEELRATASATVRSDIAVVPAPALSEAQAGAASVTASAKAISAAKPKTTIDPKKPLGAKPTSPSVKPSGID